MTAPAQGNYDPTSVVGKRFGAAFIDWLIGIVIFAVLTLVLGERETGMPSGICGTVQAQEGGMTQCYQLGGTVVFTDSTETSIIYLVGIVWAVAIYWIMRGTTGRTPGTLLLGLTCVGADGRPPGIGKAIVRTIVGIVDYIPCCFPIVGIVTIIATGKHQRVGDMAAKTYMIDAAAKGRPVDGGAGAAPMGYGVPAQQPGAPGAQQAQAQPQWDASRNTWVQYDANTGQWWQHDPATNQWVPLR